MGKNEFWYVTKYRLFLEMRIQDVILPLSLSFHSFFILVHFINSACRISGIYSFPERQCIHVHFFLSKYFILWIRISFLSFFIFYLFCYYFYLVGIRKKSIFIYRTQEKSERTHQQIMASDLRFKCVVLWPAILFLILLVLLNRKKMKYNDMYVSTSRPQFW